ncbi:MAG: bifunctional 4-hydroxy-2-oxoglutarate aldolase/2-dehydro-3-deoxy-phosphogluconate aldolase [Bifidobacteriaceae bacterium]|jgi:2-dehydro-3-deoxyphosphogluconate aldolase/(4S)-4-hydroxy-2-oxoglutarate aldolase|nr:bifunctional 4-hydroxy-2-oxoglutarate aldolase/2-dehydro-3-deoxy-phosphogluconate aldolase [Bifidobacteriaceae bacterium]
MRQFGSQLVPVVVIDNAQDANPLADALVAGGLPVAEITLRTPASLEAIRALAHREDILVGAGTVLGAAQLEGALAAGARFAVSPGFTPALLQRAAELHAWLIPGATTAAEVQQLLEWGLDLIKFFPAATAGGPGAIKALAAPFRQARFIPTGGVNADNLAEYLSLPSVSQVGGSWMVPRSAIAAGDFDGIQTLVRQAVALADQIVGAAGGTQ